MKTTAFLRMLVAIAAAALAGCGGGGGGASGDEQLKSAPTATASQTLIPRTVSVVNDTTAGDQTVIAIGELDDGGYAVVWTSTGEPGNPTGTQLLMKRYDAAGNSSAQIQLPFDFSQVTPVTSPSSFHNNPNPAVAVLRDGSIVVAYVSVRAIPGAPTGLDDHTSGIYTRRFDVNGNPVGGETELMSTTMPAPIYEYVTEPAVVALADGGYVVAWAKNLFNGPYGTTALFYAQRYDSAGQPVGDTSNFGWGDLSLLSFELSAIEDGGYMTTHLKRDQGILYTNIGIAAAPDRAGDLQPLYDLYNSSGFGLPLVSTILPLRNGGYVLWSTQADGPFMQMFDSSGTPLGAPTQPASYPYRANALSSGAAYALSDGGFVVLSAGAAPGASPVLQRYDSSGLPFGDPVQLATGGAIPLVTTLSDGGLALAWTAPGPGTGLDVYTLRIDEGPPDHQARLKSCQAQAKALSGSQHKQFMRDCLKA